MGQNHFDVNELKSWVWKELETRRLSSEPGDYSYHRSNNSVPLYSATGSAKICAALGIGLGDCLTRERWIEHINYFQNRDGSFVSPSGNQHAAGEAIVALNILGGKPAHPVKHLAPLDSGKIKDWLESLDWNGTHKDFCAGVAPIIASGFYDRKWFRILYKYITDIVTTEKPVMPWCSEEDPPWRVISCIYHITHGLDAGFIPYPFPEIIWQRLSELDYENVRDSLRRTVCTDFDYMFVLSRLVHQLPDKMHEFLERCRLLSVKMIAEWSTKREELLADFSTHDLACYLVGWSILQRALPGLFAGPVIYDIQNAPWLYRLSSVDSLSSG